jgi:type I restriction enzyme S subunit
MGIGERPVPTDEVAKQHSQHRNKLFAETNIPLLEAVPAQWRLLRLKYISLINPESLGENTEPSFTFTYIDIGNVDSLGRLTGKEEVSFASAPSRARRIVREGDIIVSTVRTYLRAITSICLEIVPPIVSTGFAVIRPNADVNSAFLAYALRAPYFIERVVANSKGVSFPAISENEFATFEIALPSMSEQSAIARFLDQVISKVDALVMKNERLIELLQEKRKSIITGTITDGLSRAVHHHPTSTERYYAIPENWVLRPLTKYLSDISDYRGSTPEKVPSGIRLITAKNVRMGFIDYSCSEEYVLESEYTRIMRRGLPRIGDILFTTEAPLGNVALVDQEKIALAQRIIRFRMNRRWFDSKFTLWAMISDPFQAQINCLSTGSTAEGLKASKLNLLYLPTPPLEEQIKIAAFLETSCGKIDALITKVREAIDRLKEYRSTLISAAVTGKIDVRGEAEATQETATS